MRFNFYKLKSIALIFVLSFAFAFTANAQALSGVKTIDGSGAGPDNYLTLKAAIDSLNLHGVGTGGVTFNIAAGHTETAPSGGYRLTATGTMANPIIFQKSGAGANPLLTAQVGTKSANSTTQIDGVFALLGSDWVTIDGIDIVDTNSANPATMEYGYALFKADSANGCHHVTIQNCKITLNRNNFASGAGARIADGSVGIYALNSTADTSIQVVVTSALGSHSFNKFYTNIIQNVNYGIVLAGRTENSPYTNADTGNEIGGSTPNSGNTIWDFGGGSGTTVPSAAIRTQSQYDLTISYNNIHNVALTGVPHPTTFRGIYLQNGSNASVDVVNNTIRLIAGATSSTVSVIENSTGSSGSGNTINISNNSIINSEYLTATSGAFYGIYNNASATNVNIVGNSFDSLIYSTVSLTGSGTIYPIYNTSGTNINITDNEIRGIRRFGTSGGTTIGIYVSSGTNQTVKRNEIHDISIDGTGTASTMYGVQTTTGTVVVDSNDIYNLSVLKTTASGAMYGIYNLASPTNENYNYNHIYNLNNAGSGDTWGIYAFTTTGLRTVSYNNIHDITLAGVTTSATALGGIRSNSSSPSIFNNKIYKLTGTTLVTGRVSGILLAGLGTAGVANIYNNLISDLSVPLASNSTTDAIRGINLDLTTSSTQINVTNNSIYLNATSSGANFTTSGIYVATSATATTAELRLRNNIIVNVSTPNGTGKTIAYRRSSTTLTNYSALSNNNVFYAGTPSISRTLYYDGTNTDSTLAQLKTRFATRDQASISVLPDFVSTNSSDANFLNISTSNATQLESGALAVAPVTFDFGGNIRAGNSGYPAQTNGGGTSPDIGAWEFDGIPAAPSITFTSLVPPGEQCTAVDHTVTLNVTANIGVVDSVKLSYSYNGTPMGTIMMNNAGGNSYTGLIPAAVPVNAKVSWTATAWNSGGLSKVFNGADYEDAPLTTLGLGIESDVQPLCLGDSATLSPTLPPPSPLGNGGTANSTSGQSPFGQLWEGMRAQYLVRASLMTSSGYSAGPLTSLSFDITAGTQTFPFEDYTIKIGHTNTDALSTATWLTDPLTTVFGPQQVPANTALPSTKKFEFNSPFVWDGVSNILIEICFQNDPTGTLGDRYSSNSTVVATSTSYTSVRGLNQDNSPSCSGSTPSSSSSALPAFVFGVPQKTFASYDWKVGGVTVGTSNTLKVSPNDTTTYVLTVLDAATGCTATDTFTLNVSNTTMGGVVTVGAGGTYNTLTEAVNAFNEVCVISSPVVFELIDTAYKAANGEVFPIEIKHNPKRNATNTLTIRPAALNTPIIYGTVATSGIIKLLGADYVIIDGSNSGTDTRDLTIQNLSTATTNAAIWIASTEDRGSSNNVIKNVNISGASASTTVAGILSGSGATLGADPEHPNNNNTIQNNRITRFQNGMYIRGGANFDQNWLITENVLGDTVNSNHLGFRGMLIGNANNFVISKNNITGVISTTGSTSIMNGIQVALNVDSGLITANDISGVRNMNTAGYGAVGITLGIGNTDANVSLSNNFIYDIRSYGNATANRNAAGIAVAGPGTGFQIVNNSIYIEHQPTVTGNLTAGLFISGVTKAGSIDVRNNILDARSEIGNPYAFAHSVADSVFSHFDNNILWSNKTNLTNIRGTNQTDIVSVRAAMPGFNNASLIEEPTYTSVNDLHIPPSTFTHLESKGQTIAGLTTDIDGDVRPGPAGSIYGGGTGYDIGADEFDGTPNLGDVITPTVSIDSITPPFGDCNSVPHTLYIKAMDASGIDSIQIRYSINGVAQTPVDVIVANPMDTSFVGVIPAAGPGKEVTFTLWVKDLSVNGNSITTAPQSYKDAVFYINVTASSTEVNAGSTVNLMATIPVSKKLGTGTTAHTNTNIDGAAYPTYWGNGRQQYLVLASELNALGYVAGSINSLSFDVATVGTTSVATLGGYTIKLANTTATTLSTFDLTPTQIVWGPQNYTPTLGVNTHTFNSPFVWDGTSNVLVEICFANGVTGTTAAANLVYQSTTSFISNIRYNSDGAAGLNACNLTGTTTSSKRPNMVFNADIPLDSVVWTQTAGGGLSDSTIYNPTATPTVPGVYTYTATAFDSVCSFSASVDVTALMPVTPIADFYLSHDTAYMGGTNTIVTLKDTSLNIPSSWKWEVIPNNVQFVGGTTNTSQHAKVVFTAPGVYDVKLVVSNPAGSDSVTKLSQVIVLLQYCASGATGTTGQDIGNVKIWSGIDTLLNNGADVTPTNNVTAIGTYSDYTSSILPIQVHYGRVYEFSIAHIASAASSTSGRAIYLDLNIDGDFDDPGERLFTSAAFLAAGVNSTGSFTIPLNAKHGLTRMRVVLSNSFSTPNPCGTFANGETEDYAVEIIAPVGDWFPPDFDTVHAINPPGGACTPVPHVVSIGVTDSTAVDSVWIVWSINGVAQPDIPMGTVVGNVYTDTIPAAPAGAAIEYSFKARDVSPQQNMGTAPGGAYVDAAFFVVAESDVDSIGLGGTIQLNAILPSPEKQVGNGTATGVDYPNPYYTLYEGNKGQYLILASELLAAGITPGPITSLALDVTNVATSLDLLNFTIKMGHTSLTSMSGVTLGTGLTQVYTTPAYVLVPNSRNVHTFQTPFVWDGVSNIMIQTCFFNGDWEGSTTASYTVTPFVSCAYYRADGEALICDPSTTTTNTSSNRPNFLFGQPVSSTLNWTSSAGGNLSATNIANPTATPSAIGTYTYTVTANDGTCSFSDSVTVKVINIVPPTAKYSANKLTAIANSTVVTLLDSTGNLPTAWDWNFTPNTVTYVNNTSNNSKNPEVTFDAPGFYSVELIVSNNAGSDTLLKPDYIEVLNSYCPSGTTTSTADSDIGKVTIGGFSHGDSLPLMSNTSANGNYRDYTSLTGLTLQKMVPVNAAISAITSGATMYAGTINVFVDYNQNGVFDLPQERVLAGAVTNAATGRVVTGMIQAPITAKVGKTLLRVINDEGGTLDIDPCLLTYGWGETEDYIVTILPPPPGDWYAPDIKNIVLSPDSQCSPVPHTVTAIITDTTSVSSAELVWEINGTPQPAIPMINTSDSTYSAVIPASGRGVVTFAISATDGSVNSNTGMSEGDTYQDEYFYVSAGPDKYIGVGQTATLNANTTLDRPFKITEFNLFNYTGGSGPSGNGSNATWPPQLPTSMYDDNIEITNLSNASANLSGYTVITEGIVHSFTFPAGTIVPAQGVVILHLGTGSTDAGNLVFSTGSGSLPSSGQNMGIILKDNMGNIADAVAVNTFTFSAGSGVTSTDWSGPGVSSPSGIAGATLQGSDQNNNSNWVTGSPSTPVSIGFINPNLPVITGSSTITWTGGVLSGPVVGSSITTPVHPTLGAYTYYAASTDGTCTYTDTIVVNVVAAPTVDIGPDSSVICGTTPRVLDAGNPGSTYVWRRDNVQVGTSQTYSATTAGLYKVTVTNQAGLSSSDSIYLSVGPAFTFSLPDRTLCPGGTITVDAGSHVGYLWSTGATTQSIQITQEGTYYVTVTNSIGCVATDTFVVGPATPPAFDLGPDQTLCGSASLILDAGNPGSTYLWSTGATTQTINASLANTYWVVVTTMSGCILTDTVVVTNLPAPTVNLGVDQTICPGSSITLDAGNAGATFLWNTGATTQTINVSSAGMYYVTVTGANTCSTTDTINITMNVAPSVNLGNDLNICTSDTVTLDAGNPGATYLWSTGATTQTIRVSNAGTYSVVVTHPTSGCTATDEVIVTNKPEPVSTFTVSEDNGQSVTFLPTVTSGLQYLWNFGDPTSSANTSQLTSPTHVFTNPGNYTVTLTVTNVGTGCKSTTSMIITVTSVGNDFAEVFKLGAAPNPFVYDTKVRYTLPEDANKVTVEVYDMIGRKVATIIENEYQVANTYEYHYKNEDLQTSSGVYIVRLTVDGKVAFTRIIDAAKR